MNDDLLNPHSALIYIMVLISAADNNMTDRELKRIGEQVRNLPVFLDFDEEELVPLAEECAAKLGEQGGLDQVLDLIIASLPARLSETAYAIACEIAAADLHVEQEELRLLQQLRDSLDLDRLTAAAIERGVRARHTTL
ncbi:MAG: tellurite resistance TerB family protein [Rhodospirillaceae bacterium]|jgi:tellurite resistance protein|nr:tellurite resistance TerB family protein [Rhodospirillaceae bacterium]MBT5896872.1 tellurite resistance TerB family protein [Rhodospirillaceae bacterium]MBT6427871.1 tellurite resistance TerB family protein [Rhodospirillaceae bacterium]MBT7758737.1 tellurite resistance TerB family protein [Rhodospirillaceae bacterium]